MKICHSGKYKISNNYNFNVMSLERYSSRWFNIDLVLAMYRASIVSNLLTFVHRSSTVAVTSPVLTAHSPECLPSGDDSLLCSPSLVITCLPFGRHSGSGIPDIQFGRSLYSRFLQVMDPLGLVGSF